MTETLIPTVEQTVLAIEARSSETKGEHGIAKEQARQIGLRSAERHVHCLLESSAHAVLEIAVERTRGHAAGTVVAVGELHRARGHRHARIPLLLLDLLMEMMLLLVLLLLVMLLLVLLELMVMLLLLLLLLLVLLHRVFRGEHGCRRVIRITGYLA